MFIFINHIFIMWFKILFIIALASATILIIVVLSALTVNIMNKLINCLLGDNENES